MSSGCGFSPAAPIISDWHVDDWMKRMQRIIPAKKPHFGNSPFRGNDKSPYPQQELFMSFLNKIIQFVRRFLRKIFRMIFKSYSVYTPKNYPKVKYGDPELFADIIEYTKLPEEIVAQLLSRKIGSFTKEWKTREVKNDYWFYLSSKGYFWGNLPHLDIDEYIKIIKEYCPPGGRILEYGGGVGNLTFKLAKEGYQAEYLELSTLQKDFLRFRAYKHNLPIKIIDTWQNLEKDYYDVIFALDVFEHIPNAHELVKNQLAPALKKNGILVDFTCYGKSIKDPMHLDKEYEKLLLRAFVESDLQIIKDIVDYRICQKVL